MRILHLAIDEKFINSAEWFFEKAYAGCNEFIIIVSKGSTVIKHVTVKSTMRIEVESRALEQRIIESIPQYSFVVFHGLNRIMSNVILRSKLTKNFLWLIWGYEVYNNYKISSNKFLGRETFTTLNNKYVYAAKNLLRPIWSLVRKQEIDKNYLVKKALKRFDAVGGLYEGERETFITLNAVKTNIKYIKFTYCPVDLLIKGDVSRVNGNNILIGNSATPSNNHIEIFNKLRGYDLSSRKLIVPLSYGPEWYSKKIIEIGKSTFESNFIPLIDFLRPDKYQEVIGTCSVVIMNHYRQQAIGNILLMLFLGAKVYLDMRSSFYDYLKKLGIIIFEINSELILGNLDSLEPLDEESIKHNQNILRKELNLQSLVKDFQIGINEWLNF